MRAGPDVALEGSADVARADDAERAERRVHDLVAHARLVLGSDAVPGDLYEVRLAEDEQHGLCPKNPKPRASAV